MITSEPLTQFKTLLEIRIKGMQRNLIILVVIFILAAAAALVLSNPGERGLVLGNILFLVLGMGWFSTWLRVEMYRNLIEFIETLRWENHLQ